MTPDDVLNKDDLNKKGIPIPGITVGPARLFVKPIFENSKFVSTYLLYQKIKNNKSADALEVCTRWFRKGLSNELLYDDFIALWISFNAFYNMYWANKKTTKKQESEGEKISFLAKCLFDNKSAEELINSKRCSQSINYLISFFKGKYLSDSGKTDWIEELSINISKEKYHEAIEKLFRTIYSIRRELFHGEKGFSQEEEIPVIQAKYILCEIIRQCIDLYLQ